MFETDNFCTGLMSTKKRMVDAVSGDPAFERWLSRQLHKMYDEVLAEEVPSELLEVVDRVTGKTSDKENGAGDAEQASPHRRRRR